MYTATVFSLKGIAYCFKHEAGIWLVDQIKNENGLIRTSYLSPVVTIKT